MMFNDIFAAGYDVVIFISRNQQLLKKFKTHIIKPELREYEQRVLFLELEGFFFYLNTELAEEATRVSYMKGYRVTVSYTPISDKEAEFQSEQIAKILLSSARKTK